MFKLIIDLRKNICSNPSLSDFYKVQVIHLRAACNFPLTWAGCQETLFKLAGRIQAGIWKIFGPSFSSEYFLVNEQPYLHALWTRDPHTNISHLDHTNIISSIT